MSQHRLIDRARSQRRMARALLERHALIRRTDTGARMLRALDAPAVPALARYLPPVDVQIAPIDVEYAPALPAVSADAPFFAPSLSASAQPASRLPPLALPERAALTARLPEAPEQLARALDVAVRSSAEVPPPSATSVTPAAFAPPVEAPASDAVSAASTTLSSIEQPAPTVAAAPDAPDALAAPTGESVRAPALPLPDAPRARRLARAVQEGGAPGERPASPARPPEAAPPTLTDLPAASESAAPQSNAAASVDTAPLSARGEPARDQAPRAARTPQEIAKLLFGDRGGIPSAQPEALAEQTAAIEQPLRTHTPPVAVPPVDAPPSAAERLRTFQSEVASARSASATSSELFQPQTQPRTSQDWSRLLAEATNPRGQGSGARTTNDQRPATNDQRPTTSDRQPATSDQRPTTMPPLSHRFVRPLASLEPSTGILPEPSTAANSPVADAHVDNRLVTAQDTLSTEQLLPADAREQTPDIENMSAPHGDSTVSPIATPPDRSAPDASPTNELVAPTTAERTPQDWAKLLAQATNPQRRGQESGVRSQELDVRRQRSGDTIPAERLPSANPAAAAPSAFRRQASGERAPASPQTQPATRNSQPAPTPSALSGFSAQESVGRHQRADSAPPPPAPSPLRETTRRFLRPLVGIDPDSVRVHRGPLADQVASAHAADAVTLGDDVLLAAGHDEESPETIGLLAHELTHVARARAPRFVPSIAHAAPEATGDEEPLARAVETRARNAARDAAQPDTPLRAPYAAAPDSAQSRARTPEEQVRWGDLPAPWEPLTGWLAGDQGPTTDDQQPITNDRRLTANNRRPTTNARVLAPTPSVIPAATPAASGAIPAVATPAMRAEQGRSLDDEQPAAPAAPAAAPPEADLDALARQVYNVLKHRLAAEQRRLG